MRKNYNNKPLTKLLAKIGQEASVSFCISLIPGLAGVLVAMLDRASFSARLLVKSRDYAAEFFTNLLYGGSGVLSRKELRRLELEQIRCAKRNKEYEKALSLVCAVLEKDAECAEALLLKATILHEGFNNSAAARACLRKLMRMNVDAEHELRSCQKSGKIAA